MKIQYSDEVRYGLEVHRQLRSKLKFCRKDLFGATSMGFGLCLSMLLGQAAFADTILFNALNGGLSVTVDGSLEPASFTAAGSGGTVSGTCASTVCTIIMLNPIPTTIPRGGAGFNSQLNIRYLDANNGLINDTLVENPTYNSNGMPTMFTLIFTAAAGGISLPSSGPNNIVENGLVQTASDIVWDEFSGTVYQTDVLEFQSNSPTPEPGTLALLGAGLVWVVIFHRKRRNNSMFATG